MEFAEKMVQLAMTMFSVPQATSCHYHPNTQLCLSDGGSSFPPLDF